MIEESSRRFISILLVAFVITQSHLQTPVLCPFTPNPDHMVRKMLGNTLICVS